jgi:hypothetical protein
MTYNGCYVSSAEVRDFVGASYDAVGGKYTIMGLDVVEAVFDAQVKQADDVVKSYVGQLDTSTGKFSLAKACALNLAGLRVVVVASGGFVTMAAGNVNYSLGDISISKGEVVRLALEYAVKNYEARFNEFLFRITAGATVVDSSEEVRSRYEYE